MKQDVRFNPDVPRLLLGYVAAVVIGSLVFLAVSLYFESPSSGYHPRSPDVLMNVIIFLFFVLPVAGVLAATPFAIGYTVARRLNIGNVFYFMGAGALCGRAVYWIFPAGINGTIPAWVSGMIGGLTFWLMVVRQGRRPTAPAHPISSN
jgi:hypothetical protein